ncbi:hypothetical protein J2Z17_004929 [Rhizobium halophytocola]|uniref:Uncharacterized protein n=1 Tax=Rhizobium halophytocola TaxID=735519 RepID=A0ABS4E6C1_9HYPH|nr:hypothetical protein [Rhizobium halophytocola]
MAICEQGLWRAAPIGGAGLQVIFFAVPCNTGNVAPL